MVTIINIFPVFIENTFVSNYHFTIITHKHPIIYNYALIYVNWPRRRKGPVMQVTYPNKHKVLLKMYLNIEIKAFISHKKPVCMAVKLSALAFYCLETFGV